MRKQGWTRRAALAAIGGAGALAGCGWLAADEPEPEPPPDPLEPLLHQTRSLAARYGEVEAANPELAERLGPLHDAHETHAAALEAVIGREPTTPAGRWVPPASHPAASPRPDDALAALRDAELAGQDQAREACLAAPPERAALLGSITAARATHVEVLA